LHPPLVSAVSNDGKVEATFRNLLEAAPDAMIVVSGEGNMIFVNARYDQDEILGQKIEMLVPERFRSSHLGHRKQFSAENRARPMGTGVQLYGLRRDGSEFPVEISLSPLQTDDGFMVLSAIRDVTTRKEMEAQLEASRTQMAASARLSALGVMAGGIAHEINNPLGIIQAYASNLVEMAQSGNVSLTSLATASSRIVETSERISGIVKSLRPAVALTGFSDLSIRDAYDLGIESQLSKPVSRKVLIAAVTKALADREQLWALPFRDGTYPTLSTSFESLHSALETDSIAFGRGGFCLRSEQISPEDSRIEFQLVFNADQQSLSGQGTVRWASEKEQALGIEIERVQEKGRSWLAQLTRENRTLSFIPRTPGAVRIAT
jgi:PAS domain S-box-containing protein